MPEAPKTSQSPTRDPGGPALLPNLLQGQAAPQEEVCVWHACTVFHGPADHGHHLIEPFEIGPFSCHSPGK